MSAPPRLAPAVSPEDYARLERRLLRERHARLEAEAIAEKGLRELWSGQRELRLLKMVAKAANSAKNSRDALTEAVRLVCEFSEWPIGHAYMTRSARRIGRYMAPTDIWWGGATRELEAFRQASETLKFAPGEGLPGRVLLSGAPAWISPLHLDPHFPRGSLALAAGLGSALAFPVLLRGKVVAVLEFFTEQQLAPDEKLLGILEKVGDHLGRAVERERGETALRTKNRKLVRALAQVEAQRRAAEAANMAKSTFLAVTSHEVRTPLNAVLGLAEGLRREALTERQASLAEGILESGSMLLRLLNAVLELSRIESGELALQNSDFSLRELLHAVVRLWRGRAGDLGIDLRLLTEGLPEEDYVHADRGKLEQAMTNLVSNALKFTPAGEAVTVSASGKLLDGRLHLDLGVEDRGPGVPHDSKAAIFEPYMQTPAGRAAGGAGLGLTISANHIRQMGGRLSVDDAPDGGALFRLTVSLETVEITTQASNDDAAVAAAINPRTLRILAAEDNEPNRRVLTILLEPADVHLTFAENGVEALQAFDREQFDLVLMDANMPVMGGVEALREIRRLSGPRARTPVHMLTANAFEDDVRTYFDAGADGVIAKPVQVRELYALLADIAQSCRAHGEEKFHASRPRL